MGQFKVKAGIHAHKDGKIYKKGEVVESKTDLCVVFREKFERVHAPAKPAEPPSAEPPTPPPPPATKPLPAAAAAAADKSPAIEDEDEEVVVQPPRRRRR